MRGIVLETWILIRASYRAFAEDLGPLKAASIAFFASLSLVPLGLLLVSVIGHVIGSEEAYARVAEAVQQNLPGASKEVLQALNVTRSLQGRWLVDIVGTFGLIWSAMNLFTNLSLILTVVWTGETQRGFLARKVVSFLAVLAAGILFLATAVMTSTLAAISSYAERIDMIAAFLNRVKFLDSALSWAVQIGIATLMFFLLYWLLPAGRVSKRAAVVAALPAALFWTISRTLFSVLVAGSSRYGQLYGPLTGAVILLLWIYYSAYIMLLCGELGAVAQKRYWPTEEFRGEVAANSH